jgi:hypothetical protein
MLSKHIQKSMEKCTSDWVPEEELIAYWIADWTKEQMVREAEEMFAHLTVKS